MTMPQGMINPEMSLNMLPNLIDYDKDNPLILSISETGNPQPDMRKIYESYEVNEGYTGKIYVEEWHTNFNSDDLFNEIPGIDPSSVLSGIIKEEAFRYIKSDILDNTIPAIYVDIIDHPGDLTITVTVLIDLLLSHIDSGLFFYPMEPSMLLLNNIGSIAKPMAEKFRKGEVDSNLIDSMEEKFSIFTCFFRTEMVKGLSDSPYHHRGGRLGWDEFRTLIHFSERMVQEGNDPYTVGRGIVDIIDRYNDDYGIEYTIIPVNKTRKTDQNSYLVWKRHEL